MSTIQQKHRKQWQSQQQERRQKTSLWSLIRHFRVKSTGIRLRKQATPNVHLHHDQRYESDLKLPHS